MSFFPFFFPPRVHSPQAPPGLSRLAAGPTVAGSIIIAELVQLRVFIYDE
jgi:hypothetical protein